MQFLLELRLTRALHGGLVQLAVPTKGHCVAVWKLTRDACQIKQDVAIILTFKIAATTESHFGAI